MARGPLWNDADLEFVKETLHTLTMREQADRTGRSVRSIQQIRKRFTAGTKNDQPWTDEQWALLGDTLTDPLDIVADKLGRSTASISQARLRYRRANGIPARGNRGNTAAKVPHQELHDRPPGTYVEVIGKTLMDYKPAWDCWLHAHGYVSYQIRGTDEFNRVTLTCVKEK